MVEYRSIYAYTVKRERVGVMREDGGDILTSDTAALAFLRAMGLHEEEQEHLVTLILDNKRRVRCCAPVSVGTPDETYAYSREVFRVAIMEGAVSVIIAHNHPSGDPTPSEADIAITKTLRKAGEVLGIKLVDHIIVGGDKHVSMLESGDIWRG
jgi:DNA repair protein RadC